MNLFELNARMAVKLNQSLETLYNLEYFEYSMLLNIINEDIEAHNKKVSEIEKMQQSKNTSFKVNLPTHLKLK